MLKLMTFDKRLTHIQSMVVSKWQGVVCLLESNMVWGGSILCFFVGFWGFFWSLWDSLDSVVYVDSSASLDSRDSWHYVGLLWIYLDS